MARTMFFIYFRSDHMETINRYDLSTIFLAIIWKPAFTAKEMRPACLAVVFKMAASEYLFFKEFPQQQPLLGPEDEAVVKQGW